MFKSEKWLFEDEDQVVATCQVLFGREAWSLLAKLEFNGFVRATKAEWAFRRWISKIKKASGTSDFRWLRANLTEIEEGRVCGLVVLVGGLSILDAEDLRRLWSKLGPSAYARFVHPDDALGRFCDQLRTAKHPELRICDSLQFSPWGVTL